jgi:hypothetical protein
MRTTLLAVAVLAVSACAGNSFDGKVAGEAITIKSSAFLQSKDSNGKPTGAAVYIADVDGNGCDYIKSNRQPKSGTYVVFSMVNRDSNNNAVAPTVGDYTVVDPLSLDALTTKGLVGSSIFTKNDTSCTNVLASKNADSKSGVIKVGSYSAVAGGSISGSFDITYGDQADHVTGGFSAEFCDAQFTLQPNCE